MHPDVTRIFLMDIFGYGILDFGIRKLGLGSSQPHRPKVPQNSSIGKP